MLQGEKIELIAIQRIDTQKILYWRNQAFVQENFIYQKPFTKEIHEKWLEEKVDTGKVKQFIIYKKEHREPIGSVYLRDIDLESKKAEYGIFIGEKKELGKGYGTEAANLIINYGFNELKLHKIFLRVFAKNEQAIASYKKAGFIIEGHFKDEVRIEDRYYDIVFMSRIKQEA